MVVATSQKAHNLSQHPNPITTMSLLQCKYLLSISTNELEGPFTYDISLFSKYKNFMKFLPVKT